MNKPFYKIIVYLIFVLILLSCETKEDKLCRDQLSSTIRQINAIFQGYADNKSAEESLNLFGIRDYYSNYTNQLNELRRELAKHKITKKFTSFNKGINDIISDGINYFNNRQDLILTISEISSNFSDWGRYTEQSTDYLIKSMTSNYSSDFYSEQSDEYSKKAEESYRKLKENFNEFENLCMGYNKIKLDITSYCDSLNLERESIKILETLGIHSIINDTTDFLDPMIKEFTNVQELIKTTEDNM